MSAPVAINGRATVRREIGGVERVAIELAARLPALRPERYRVLRPPPALAHAAGHVWEQALLPLAARGSRLLLSPANLAPLAGARNVVYVHDAAPLREPAWFSRGYGAWHRLALRRLARGARLLLVPSAFVRGELGELLGVEPERVRVVPPGVDPRFAPGAAEGARPAGQRAALRARAGHRQRAQEPRSARAPGAGSSRRRGSTCCWPAPPVPTCAASRAARARLGYVPEAALPALYAHAAVLALPSLYEGFGLPCLEAMACGTPVVAADRAALPEACGGAALLADPADPAAFAAALIAAAGPERERLRAAGLERAGELSWERSAQLADAAVGELLA